MKQNEGSVQIDGITGEILQKVIEFCYSRKIEVTTDIVDELLEASAFLQIPQSV